MQGVLLQNSSILAFTDVSFNIGKQRICGRAQCLCVIDGDVVWENVRRFIIVYFYLSLREDFIAISNGATEVSTYLLQCSNNHH